MPRCILPSQQSCKVHKVESNAKENYSFLITTETKYLRCKASKVVKTEAEHLSSLDKGTA